jgi:UDPglucose 6-dehydrogenase
MNILIAGYGFVGRAHESVLKNKHNVHIYDPFLGYTELPSDIDAMIVCVSTPPRLDGSCEMANVFDVIERIPKVPTLIKSTISLEGWHVLRDSFEDRIAFSPEFLRAATAEQDFKNTQHLYFGGNNLNLWIDLFSDVFLGLQTTVKPIEELILIKYFRNSFLATKVAFFNQIYDLCEKIGVDYESVAEGVSADSRIGSSHTQITKERGFGGHCFPKDTSAIVKTGEFYQTDLTLIAESIAYNRKIRKD